MGSLLSCCIHLDSDSRTNYYNHSVCFSLIKFRTYSRNYKRLKNGKKRRKVFNIIIIEGSN